MRFVVRITILYLFIMVPVAVNAAGTEEWCKANQRLCSAVINTCESHDNLDCDAYMKKIMRGEDVDLEKELNKS